MSDVGACKYVRLPAAAAWPDRAAQERGVDCSAGGDGTAQEEGDGGFEDDEDGEFGGGEGLLWGG